MGTTVPKVMSGARAKLGVSSAGSGAVYLGIYNSFNYNVVLGITPTYILGRLSAASLEYTSSEPVQCSGQGYRVLGGGPYQAGKAGSSAVNAGANQGGAGTPYNVGGGQVPTLKDMLTFDDLTFAVYDRLTTNGGTRVDGTDTSTARTPVAVIKCVKPGGYSSGLTARQLQEMTMSYTGILIEDETATDNGERLDATPMLTG